MIFYKPIQAANVDGMGINLNFRSMSISWSILSLVLGLGSCHVLGLGPSIAQPTKNPKRKVVFLVGRFKVMYREPGKSMQILLSNSQAELGRTVKHEQE